MLQNIFKQSVNVKKLTIVEIIGFKFWATLWVSLNDYDIVLHIEQEKES